jgi:hypothetical protein
MHSLYAVTPDDRRFLMWREIGNGSAADGSLVIAEHWLTQAIEQATRR